MGAFRLLKLKCFQSTQRRTLVSLILPVIYYYETPLTNVKFVLDIETDKV